MTRAYRKTKRADAQEETRGKIVRAAMALHLKQGVATTSFLDVAQEAGVGAATVYRHFPTIGALVEACGAHVWEAIEPPRPEDAAALFAGLDSRSDRLDRLVEELDAFYSRAAAPLWSAVRDQDRVPELTLFLTDVRAGVTALVAEALEETPHSRPVKIAAAIADFPTWRAVSGTGLGQAASRAIIVAMIVAALSAYDPGDDQSAGPPASG